MIEPTADMTGAWWIVVDDAKRNPSQRSFYSSCESRADADELCASAQKAADDIEQQHVADLAKQAQNERLDARDREGFRKLAESLAGRPVRLAYSVVPRPADMAAWHVEVQGGR